MNSCRDWLYLIWYFTDYCLTVGFHWSSYSSGGKGRNWEPEHSRNPLGNAAPQNGSNPDPRPASVLLPGRHWRCQAARCQLRKYFNFFFWSIEHIPVPRDMSSWHTLFFTVLVYLASVSSSCTRKVLGGWKSLKTNFILTRSVLMMSCSRYSRVVII